MDIEWIRCKDRMPDSYEMCIVWLTIMPSNIAATAFWNGDRWCVINCDHDYIVEYWIPMPRFPSKRKLKKRDVD